MDNPDFYHIWLSYLYPVGAGKIAELLDHFGGPEQLWAAGTSKLYGLQKLTDKDISIISKTKDRDVIENKLKWVYANKIKIIGINDDGYPSKLRFINQPPVVLYIKGSLPVCRVSTGIVGSRKPSAYGTQCCYSLSYQLAKCGVEIVSGMARGIDTCAHAGALKAGGKTVAVLGCGIDIAYPKENTEMIGRIAQSGAVITEYPPGTPPLKYNFPARNRIISGLSDGVIVVEAGKRSGSLITVDYALNQGKEVFALPGNITSLLSSGTNQLLKDGARLVTCADDILDIFKITRPRSVRKKIDLGQLINASGIDLNEDEIKIIKCLEGGEHNLDAIASECGLSVSETGSAMVLMELKGIVEYLPGSFYRLKIS